MAKAASLLHFFNGMVWSLKDVPLQTVEQDIKELRVDLSAHQCPASICLLSTLKRREARGNGRG